MSAKTLAGWVPHVSLSFLFGVFLASFTGVSALFAIILLFISCLLLLVFFFHPQKEISVLFALMIFALAVGIFRYDTWNKERDDPMIVASVGKMTIFRGVVIDEPDARESGTRLTVLVHRMNDDGHEVSVSGKVLLLTERYPEYAYGDILRITGMLKEPDTFSSPDGRMFNYPMYLKTKGISHVITRPAIIREGGEGGNIVYKELFRLKQGFTENLAHAFGEPMSALASGILVGEKRSLGEEWTERFRRAGIVHIIVLSGYNMTIVAQWLSAMFLFLGFHGSIAVSSLGIILFSVMAGGGATVIRAGIMALLALLARLLGRTYIMSRALLLAGAGMVAHTPGILAYDPSFQLSFLATVGLVLGVPFLAERFPVMAKQKLLGETLMTTLATQLFVLPLLVYQTGMLSVVSLLANILVLPLVPLAMGATFVAGMVGYISEHLALLVGIPGSLLLSFILAVGKYASALPFSVIYIPPFSGLIVLLLYIIILGMTFLVNQKS